MDRAGVPGDFEAVYVTVTGRVQGVGFRPYLNRLAEEFGIKGTAQNNMDGVKLAAEGPREAVRQFLAALPARAPRLARIDRMEAKPAAWHGFASFDIIESDRSGASSLVIPVDSAVCPDCLAEMNDSADPRYRYPFINCTQCGPRYTIIRELPYDRPYTSMSGFPLCPACRRQYEDIRDRRHHAQPVACPACGPAVTLHESGGEERARGDEAVRQTRELLRSGAIVAVKGIGGYHLACNASDAAAVRRLRERKRRPRRPLAVMARDAAAAGRVCCVSAAERALLCSPEAPIVVLRQRAGGGAASGGLLPLEELAPQMQTLGILLPYTPLHHLLLADDGGDVGLPYVVMTSANPSGQPLLYRDEEAFAYLAGIADYVLANNRPILHPIDDSVVQVKEGAVDFFRRARGYVPDPMTTRHRVDRITALGGQQKNTFALGRGEQIIIGPHIGDLGHIEVERHWRREHRHLAAWMGVAPRAVALDLHPGYETRALLDEFARPNAPGPNTAGTAAAEDVAVVPVQHHHAHLVSCLEDNGIAAGEACYGLILDGTGYGGDGRIWGFELLHGSASGYERLGHLRYTPLPGGEACIRQPWRTGAAMLMALLPETGAELAARLYPSHAEQLPVLAAMAASGLNTPLAGTCGRLFDAVSSMLGLCDTATYDGEAAIVLSELAAFAEDAPPEPYPFTIGVSGGLLEIDAAAMLEQIAQDRLSGVSTERIALRFHETVAQAAVRMVRLAHAERPERGRQVALSGGSFHNRCLTRRVRALLTEDGFTALLHGRVPCSDGGLSLGQLIVAAHAVPVTASCNRSESN